MPDQRQSDVQRTVRASHVHTTQRARLGIRRIGPATWLIADPPTATGRSCVTAWISYFRPGFGLAAERERREQAGAGETYSEADLYPMSGQR